MGWIETLRGEVVGLDTTPLIYFIEENPTYLDINLLIISSTPTSRTSLFITNKDIFKVYSPTLYTDRKYERGIGERRNMSEIRPSIKIVTDVGYRVISKDMDGNPKTVWRCYVKEGQYGKFVSVEKHFIRRMEGKKIAESDWARKSFNFPYDKKDAFAVWNTIRELIEEAFGAGAELEKEVEEEFGDELEGLEEEL